LQYLFIQLVISGLSEIMVALIGAQKHRYFN